MVNVEALLKPFLGYVELKMYDAANDELENLPTEFRRIRRCCTRGWRRLGAIMHLICFTHFRENNRFFRKKQVVCRASSPHIKKS
jgi:hypothetical protein